jgi:hypothetical protein
LTLQNGSGGYTGSEDTYIYQYATTTNYCTSEPLKVGYKQQYGTLVRFDLSGIPAGSTVTQARLEVYATGWDGTNMTIEAYRILRSTTYCAATWERAQVGNAWGTAGCNNTVSDRSGVAESSVTTSGISDWYSFGLTSLVQGWVDGSVVNKGLLLRGASSLSTSSFNLASNHHGTASWRPKLVVTYRSAGGSSSPRSGPPHSPDNYALSAKRGGRHYPEGY